MDNLRCISCGKEMSKHYLYCFKCNRDKETLEACKGTKVNGDQCTIRTNQKYCIYHVPKKNKKYEFVDE